MQDMIEVIAGKRFRIKQKIGQGAFSAIHLGKDIQTQNQVCIKIQVNSQLQKHLEHQAKIYRILEGGVGIPKLYWAGSEGDCKLLVIDVLGPSLQDLFIYCRKKFSLKTVLMISQQIFSRIQFMHSNKFIHRDIKPQNFLVGLGAKAQKIYMIDFGSALKFQVNGEHIPPGNCSFDQGHDRFKSVQNHMGHQQSRRDDLESVGYMLIYFLMGQLPWEQVFSFQKEQRNMSIKQRKVEIPIELLCYGIPKEFATYFSYEEPDYNYIRKLFRDLAARQKIDWNYIFDWAKMTGDASASAVRPTRKKQTTFSDESTWSHIVKK